MMTREDITARRDEMLARRDELKERADQIREKFAENVDRDTVSTAVGWTLMSGGIAFGVTQWIRGRRSVFGLIGPALIVIGGVSLLGNSALHRRGIRIDEAEMAVREQLSALDPVARFRVLRDVNRESLPFVRHSHN